jgi:hypothetical protein
VPHVTSTITYLRTFAKYFSYFCLSWQTAYDGQMKSIGRALGYFKVPVAIFVLGIAMIAIFAGTQRAFIVAVLALFELALSFDNAIINATVLKRLSLFWQRMFLTVGLAIAVVGMRLLFPVLLVAVTAKIGFGAVVQMALHDPTLYATSLAAAHVAITSFGAVYLLMLFLDFLIDESKRVHWFAMIERPLARAGRLKTLSTLIALIFILVASRTWASSAATTVVAAGMAGLVTYLLVRGLSRVFAGMGGTTMDEDDKVTIDHRMPAAPVVGMAALFLFIYLEVLDASFSFDGVVGAFAITTNIWMIALGLGFGSYLVRELTVWMVRNDTLQEFIYLEHGAQYSVGALAAVLAISMVYPVPQAITGFIGIVFIAWALRSSMAHRKRQKQASILPGGKIDTSSAQFRDRVHSPNERT